MKNSYLYSSIMSGIRKSLQESLNDTGQAPIFSERALISSVFKNLLGKPISISIKMDINNTINNTANMQRFLLDSAGYLLEYGLKNALDFDIGTKRATLDLFDIEIKGCRASELANGKTTGNTISESQLSSAKYILVLGYEVEANTITVTKFCIIDNVHQQVPVSKNGYLYIPKKTSIYDKNSSKYYAIANFKQDGIGKVKFGGITFINGFAYDEKHNRELKDCDILGTNAVYGVYYIGANDGNGIRSLAKEKLEQEVNDNLSKEKLTALAKQVVNHIK